MNTQAVYVRDPLNKVASGREVAFNVPMAYRSQVAGDDQNYD
jgi:hypothetical protein